MMTHDDIEFERRKEKARKQRYKRPALSMINYDDIVAELDEIRDASSDITFLLDTDENSVLDAFNGDEDEVFEFRMALEDLCSKAWQLRDHIAEIDDGFGDVDARARLFNDCLVGLIGDRYKIIGFDTIEEDYYSLTRYEEGLAQTEAGKRLCRMTKAELLSTIGQCLGIALAYIDLKNDYDNLRTSFDILRDNNAGIVAATAELLSLYDVIASGSNDMEKNTRFDNLCLTLPARVWVE